MLTLDNWSGKQPERLPTIRIIEIALPHSLFYLTRFKGAMRERRKRKVIKTITSERLVIEMMTSL